MKLKIQKRLASDVFKCSKKHVRFDTEMLEEIKKSITKADIKSLISENIIYKKPIVGVSRVRARKIRIQKSKGQMRGDGSRKGKKTARLPRKKRWMLKIRAQRDLLKILKEKEIIAKDVYRQLYKKSQGGFFRSRRHIKLYIEEHNLSNKEK